MRLVIQWAALAAVICLAGAQQQEVQYDSVIVKPEETVKLSCESGSVFNTCSWQLPSGENCSNILPEDTSQCRSVSNIYYSTSTTSCDIEVKDIHESHSGNWTCFQDGVQIATADIAVFHQGNLDCPTYGTVTVEAGHDYTVECIADNARPAGQLEWKVGSKENTVLKERREHSVEKEDNGRWTLRETMNDVAKISDDGSSVYVTYTQRDSDGTVLYQTEEIIDLKVKYLKIIQKNIPEIRPGGDHSISIEILSSQQPKVKWLISGQYNSMELTEDMNKYENYELLATRQDPKSAGKYVTTLRITEASEMNAAHTFQLQASADGDSLRGKETIKINFDSFRDPIDDESFGTSSTIIIIIVVIIVIIVAAIVIGTVFYAKTNETMCFAKTTGVQTDVEQSEPLQDQSKDMLKSDSVHHHTATSRP